MLDFIKTNKHLQEHIGSLEGINKELMDMISDYQVRAETYSKQAKWYSDILDDKTKELTKINQELEHKNQRIAELQQMLIELQEVRLSGNH